MSSLKVQLIAVVAILCHVAVFLITMPQQGNTYLICHEVDCNPNVTVRSCYDVLKDSNSSCTPYRAIKSCLESVCEGGYSASFGIRQMQRQIDYCPGLPDGQCVHEETKACFMDLPFYQTKLNKTQCIYLNKNFDPIFHCLDNVTNTCNSTYVNNLVHSHKLDLSSRTTECLYVDW